VNLIWILLACLVLPEPLGADPVRITPRVLYPGENLTAQTWLLAPHIIAVRVIKVDFLGPELEAVPPRAVMLRLARVTAAVENVISGKPLPQTIEFYSFTNVSGVGNAPYLYISSLNPGSESVVLLREEAGLLRTIVDLNEPVLVYHTGRHSQADLPLYSPSPQTSGEWRERPPGAAIAYLLLTPADGCDVVSLSKTLPLTVERLTRFAPTGYIVELLRHLERSPEAVIQRAACESLATDYRVEDACIEHLEHSSDAASQKLGAALAEHAKADEPALLEELEGHPFELSDVYGEARDFRGALGRFVADRRSRVRQRACEILRAVYRMPEFSDCGR